MARAETTADRLLAGAAALFREKGYAGTTTRELSGLLGLQNASLYHHISGKEDLLFQLCMGALEHVSNGLDECLNSNDEPVVILEACVRRYTEIVLHDQDRITAMLVEIRSLSDERRNAVVAARDENVAKIREVIELAQQAGQLTDAIESKYLTLGLFNLLNWSIFWWRADGEISAEHLGDILWTMFAQGVTPR